MNMDPKVITVPPWKWKSITTKHHIKTFNERFGLPNFWIYELEVKWNPKNIYSGSIKLKYLFMNVVGFFPSISVTLKQTAYSYIIENI